MTNNNLLKLAARFEAKLAQENIKEAPKDQLGIQVGGLTQRDINTLLSVYDSISPVYAQKWRNMFNSPSYQKSEDLKVLINGFIAGLKSLVIKLKTRSENAERYATPILAKFPNIAPPIDNIPGFDG